MSASRIPEPLREELLRCLMVGSADRARIIGELTERDPGMADLLMELEADYELSTKFEIELLAVD